MEAVAGAFAALSEALVFLNHFKDLSDPRQPGKVIYPLDEVLLLCLLAVLGRAETFVDIALFGEKKLALLRRFRPFRDGTPSHDQLEGLRPVFRGLRPQGRQGHALRAENGRRVVAHAPARTNPARFPACDGHSPLIAAWLVPVACATSKAKEG